MRFQLVTNWLLVTCLLGSVAAEDAGDSSDSEEFFEVDVRKIISNDPIQFGTSMHGGNVTRYEKLLLELGPVYKTAYWQTVWEVSGAAPAPREADDDAMERWVGSVYWNIASSFEGMENTTKMLLDKDIQYIAAAATAPNSYHSTERQIKRRREREAAEKEGIEYKEPDWSEEPMESSNPDHFFQTEYLNDFAKFWAVSIKYLEERKIRLPYLEMMWEPDSGNFMYMSPVDYAAFLKQTRMEMRARNITDGRHKIVGPGTSQPSAAAEYIKELVKDKEAYDMLDAWSVHLKDDGQSMSLIEREIQQFRQALKTYVPSSWPKKTIMVTTFSYNPSSNQIFADIEFNGDMQHCYYKLHGYHQHVVDFIPNSMAQSPVTGVRLLASLFLQYSFGFSKSIYTSLADHVWSHDCSGMFDRHNRRKQIFVAFSTFLPYIEKDSVAIKRQWKNSKDCYITAVKSKTRIIFAVANPSSSSCIRSFSLKGVNVKRLHDAFTVSYNNGTVSLAATHPSEALVLKQPLSYDVFPSENEDGKDVVEFDIVVGPRASASAIINLGAAIQSADEEEPKTTNEADKQPHSEL